jgi:hypothetical protein
MAVERAPKMYAASKGAHISNASAQVVGPELDRLASTFPSGLTPAAVLDRASTRGTPLYEWDQDTGYFEWDDVAAAEAHREEQARLLIRSVVIKVQSGSGAIRTRAFHVIAENDKRSYRSIDEIVTNDDYIDQIKRRFQNELIRLDKTYRAYLSYVEFSQQYAPVFEAIAEVAPTEPVRRPRRGSRYVRQGEHITLVAAEE